MTRWEYRVVDKYTDNPSEYMDAMGYNGWELVCIDQDGSLVYKRPLEQDGTSHGD